MNGAFWWMHLGHQYTPQRGRAWLTIVGGLALILNATMILMIAEVLPPGFFLAAYVLFSLGAVCACLDFVIPAMKEVVPLPEEMVRLGSLWRDRTNPSAMLKVVDRDGPGLVLVERTIPPFPGVPTKPMRARESELRRRYEEVPDAG